MRIPRGARAIRLDKGLWAVVDPADHAALSAHRWYAHLGSNGRVWYARASIKGSDGRRRGVYMHRFLMPDVGPLDHINGDGLDNRRVNIRAATPAQNSANSRGMQRAASRFKGVSRHRGNKWRAQIRYGERREHLGLFATEDEAALAYNAAALRVYGEFARLNQVKTAEIRAAEDQCAPHDPRCPTLCRRCWRCGMKTHGWYPYDACGPCVNVISNEDIAWLNDPQNQPGLASWEMEPMGKEQGR